MDKASPRQSEGLSSLRPYACWQTLQALFVFCFFLLALYGYYHQRAYISSARSFAFPLIAGFAAIGLVQPRVRRRWDVRLLIAFCAWVLFVELYHYNASYGDQDLTVYRVVLCALVCFPLAHVLPAGIRQQVLHALLHALLFVLAALCVVALYGVLHEWHYTATESIDVAGDAIFGVDAASRRLYLLMNPNRGGLLCNIMLLLGLYLGLRAKRLWTRLYCFLACAVFFVVLSLTDSRSSMLSVAGVIGLLGFLAVRRGLRTGRPWLRMGAGLLCGIACAAACYGLFGLAVRGVEEATVQVRLRSAGASGAALAEAPASEAASQATEVPIIIVTEQGEYPLEAERPAVDAAQSRDFDIRLNDLTGRTQVWSAAFAVLRANPRILLTGTSYEQVMMLVQPRLRKPMGHLHNAFLQVLMALGLPGLLLLLGFLIPLAIRAARLLWRRDAAVPLADSFLPLVLLSCIAVAMVEAIFFLTDQVIFDILFFLVAGLVTVKAEALPAGPGAEEAKRTEAAARALVP